VQEAVVACGGGDGGGKGFFNAGELDAARAQRWRKGGSCSRVGVVKPSTFRQPALVARLRRRVAWAGSWARLRRPRGGYLLVGIEAEDGEMAEAADAARIRRLAEFCAMASQGLQ